jgi:hypothetical protein
MMSSVCSYFDNNNIYCNQHSIVVKDMTLEQCYLDLNLSSIIVPLAIFLTLSVIEFLHDKGR